MSGLAPAFTRQWYEMEESVNIRDLAFRKLAEYNTIVHVYKEMEFFQNFETHTHGAHHRLCPPKLLISLPMWFKQGLVRTPHVSFGKSRLNTYYYIVIQSKLLDDFVVGEQTNEVFPCKLTKDIIRQNHPNPLSNPQANSVAIGIK